MSKETCTHHWTVTSECPMCLRAEVEALRDKAIRFDLDAIGIASRERSDVELVELRAEVAALRAARQRVVLTVQEIADLACFTGDSEPDERYVIEPAIPEVIIDQYTGVTTRHRFVAYLEEYPEKGVWPLGPPLEEPRSE